MTSAISAAGLTKRFARASGYRQLLPFARKQFVTAVNGVSLEIGQGQLFGLLGPNGAGKTTLIKLMCCLVLPDTGTAQVFGHDTQREELAVKKLVGLVSVEERSFFWRLTARENLYFFASLYRLPRLQAHRRIEELLSLVGLSGEADIRFQNSSTGMRQKLAIARGLLSEPRLLFVDEPTRSLDPVSAEAVRTFLREQVTRHGKTVVLATHNLNEAEQLCDRLAIMDHGRIAAQGTVPELRALFQTHEACEMKVANLSANIFSELQQINGVVHCQYQQHNGVADLQLKLTDRAAVLPRVLQVLIGSGAEVRDCQLRELPLEEIFIHALQKGKAEEKR